MQASTATALFVLYAALNGATLSFIFIIYTRSSIASTFFVCAATFIACSIYGWTTKRDLTSMGGFMMMVFVGLTAYDTQHLKTMAVSQPADVGASAVRKGAILGALKLYLDFINLFLMLLRILGNRE
jgi:FtsH-binding integral membrane protein